MKMKRRKQKQAVRIKDYEMMIAKSGPLPGYKRPGSLKAKGY